jgi:hypothetical protein
MPDYVWIQNVVFPLIGMAMGGFGIFAVYRTLNRALDRRHEARLGVNPGLADQVERLQGRVEQLELQTERVQELEERLDFAERMLAQQSQRPMLGGEH